MSWYQGNYYEVRDLMKPGDIVAFGGKGSFSQIIKWVTKSSVSHVGIVLQSQLLIDGEEQTGKFNQIIESTSVDGYRGVSISRLSDRVETYDGEVWWLPLSEASRVKLNGQKFYDFLLNQNEKRWDIPRAIGSALDAIDHIPVVGKLTHNTEDYSKLFCSELAAAGLKEGNVIDHLNASEVTPIDLCRFNLYDSTYCQMKGPQKLIDGFNTLNPNNWGVV